MDRASSPDIVQRLAAGRLASFLPTKLPLLVVTAPPPAGKPGVKLAVSLERVLPLKSVEVSQRQKRYLAGNRSVPNPKRAGYEQKLLDTERSLEDAERRQATVLRDYMQK